MGGEVSFRAAREHAPSPETFPETFCLFAPSTLSAFGALEHLHYFSCVSINHDPNEPELCRAAMAALFGSIRDRRDFACCKQLHGGTRPSVYGFTISFERIKSQWPFCGAPQDDSYPIWVIGWRNLGCWGDDGPANPTVS